MNILFTSDLHGNMWNYRKLREAVSLHKPDIVIDGGDMLPNDGSTLHQGKFIQTQLMEFMKYLHELGIYYLCIPGNNDLKMFDPIYEETCKQFSNVAFLDGRKTIINDYEFIGMALIVDYPYRFKDRCRKDTKDYVAEEPMEEALISTDGKLQEIKDWPKYIETLPTIEDELKILVRPENPTKTIYIMHMPPAKIWDSLSRSGSSAICEFLKANQPRMSLHGHFHDVSQKWYAQLGKTVCIRPGQSGDFTYAIIDADSMKWERLFVR